MYFLMLHYQSIHKFHNRIIHFARNTCAIHSCINGRYKQGNLCEPCGYKFTTKRDTGYSVTCFYCKSVGEFIKNGFGYLICTDCQS